MMERMILRLGRVAAALAIVPLLASGVAAENVIEVGDLVVQSGQRSAEVTVNAATRDALTLLSVDVTFDESLCESIEAVTTTKTGRTRADVQEGGSRCPRDGSVRLVMLDLTGAAAVPAGDGPIARLAFRLRPGAEGVYPLGLRVNQASNGPIAVALSLSSGDGSKGDGDSCLGDCDGSGDISIAELIAAVNIALQMGGVATCPSVDRNQDATVTVDEIVAAVQNALAGCPSDGGAG